MAYTPTNWATGDVISSAKMNKLEQGVADAEVFIAYYSTTTYAEIAEALQADRAVVCARSMEGRTVVYPIVALESTRAVFGGVYDDDAVVCVVTSADVWSSNVFPIGGGSAAPYELIASVEIAEDGINQITVTKDSQNRDLRLKHAYAVLEIPTATNGNTTPTAVRLSFATMYQNAQGQDVETSNFAFGAYIDNACATELKRCKLISELERTLWKSNYAVYGANESAQLNVQSTGGNFVAKQLDEQYSIYYLYGSIWKITATTTNSAIFFPVGTKLKIFGVLGE